MTGRCTCSPRSTPRGAVLGQPVVGGKTNEISALGPLLDRVDIFDAIVTADALPAQRGHVTYLTGRGAHWLLTVKGNRPTLLAQLRALPWTDVPVADHTSDQGHGWIETRTLKLTAIATSIGFPGAQLALPSSAAAARPTVVVGVARASTRSPT